MEIIKKQRAAGDKKQEYPGKPTSIRLLKEMGSVVYDKSFAKKNPELELYCVYRKIKAQGNLRYDITLMPSLMLGEEFVRTKGNRNSEGYQELYTVLKGKAVFFIQKAKNGTVEDARAIETKKGEWAIIPPDYSVITINPSKEVLKTGNWVSQRTQNIYEELEKMKGACYFALNRSGRVGWVKNKNYKRVPDIKIKRAQKKRPESLEFLDEPNK